MTDFIKNTRLGDFELYLLSDGTYKPDGGTMFGAIPKVLWSRLTPPDELNRIVLGLNILLIQAGRVNVLIDTGIGEKLESKWVKIYDRDCPLGLLGSLARVGLEPEEVDMVILTHLHFDHCGGNTKFGDRGKVVPTFPRAQYFIQRSEWEYALNPDLRSRVGYLPENFLPLERTGQLQLLGGDVEVLKGIRVVVTGGHTAGHQIVRIESGGETALFLGDLVPTVFHLKIPYITSYDLYPLDTMRVKERVLKEALQEGWLMVLGHDTQEGMGYLRRSEEGLALKGIAPRKEV